MHPLLVHYCTVCNTQTSVPFSASVFSQLQTCSHCGATCNGVNLPPPTPPPELPDAFAMQQEELARLFSHNLTLSQPRPEYTPIEQPQKQVEHQALAQQQPVTYISQHYTHSWHATPKSAPASVISHSDSVDSELEAVLLRNSIDPSSLYPSQIHLFRNADNDQRLRLLELWRISPPSYGGQEAVRGYGITSATDLQQEERMAELRYESLMRDRAQQHHEQQFTMGDDNMTTDSAAVHEVSNILAPHSPEDHLPQAEPYILSGYEMLAKREYEDQALRDSSRYNQSVDPIYKANPGVGGWGKADLQDMENSYGAYAAMRDYDPVVQPAVHEFEDDMVM